MLIVNHDVCSLIDKWMQAELNGEHFPVDLDLAWSIPGYADKGKAKRRLTSKSSHLIEGIDYKIDKGVPLTRTGKSELSGRSGDKVVLTCDAFKQLCLIAETEKGRLIRQYFIEAEKKWNLVQRVDPELAQQIELMKLQADIAKFNASMMENQRFIMEKSESILSLHGPQMLALIQGRPDAVVEKVETVTETVICQGDRRVSFVGRSTAELGKELGFKTGKQFEQWLERQGRGDLICEGLRAVQAPYVPSENLAEVKRLWAENRKAGGRQLLLGE